MNDQSFKQQLCKHIVHQADGFHFDLALPTLPNTPNRLPKVFVSKIKRTETNKEMRTELWMVSEELIGPLREAPGQ
jgi:hypothetical protein